MLWSQHIQVKTKTNIYRRPIVKPITTYGVENWQLTSRIKRRLKAVEIDFLRQAFRVSKFDHTGNKVIKERTNFEEDFVGTK